MTLKLTLLALALGLALPVAAATTATISPATVLPPCQTAPQDATAKADTKSPKADVICAPAMLGANIIPLVGGTDDDSQEHDDEGDND